MLMMTPKSGYLIFFIILTNFGNCFFMRTMIRLIFFGCLALFTSSCDRSKARFGKDREFPRLNYTGDGEFVDHGRKSGIFRFVLDLGQVNLKEEFTKIYELKGLPEVEFVCYLRVDQPLGISGKWDGEFKAGHHVVEMILTDEDCIEVFSESAPLSQWTWSGSVGELQTDLYTIRTMFTPKQAKSYKLSLRVPKKEAEAPAGRLLLMGGGWKVYN